MNARFAGMVLAVLVSYSSAWVPFGAVGLPGFLDPIGIGLAGAPVAALLGWWLTPAVVTGSWRRALAIGLGSGLVAPLLGLLAIVYGIVVTGLAGGPQEAGNGLVGAIFVGLYGLAYCFVVLPVTIPSGIAWTVIARGLRPWLRVRPGDDRHLAGLEVVVVVLVLVAVGALLVPLGEPAVP